MASIERTAYPRFKESLTNKELVALYQPTDKELCFIRKRVITNDGRLTLLILLKCHQRLGYITALQKVPLQIRRFLCRKLGLPENTPLRFGSKIVRHRYRQAIHSYLDVKPFSQGGQQVAEAIIRESAYTMSDPADLINVAIERLIRNRFELPAFSTIDRLAGQTRQQVHEELYRRVSETLTTNDAQSLDLLLLGQSSGSEQYTDFNRIKESPGTPTLKHMRHWVERIAWLDSLLDMETGKLLTGVAHTKIRQFAAEAKILELGDIRDIHNSRKRHTLLACLVHQMRVQTRDDLVTMFLKRMRRIHKGAKEQLQQLRDEHREIEEQLMEAFSLVVDCVAEGKSDTTLGRKVRSVVEKHGGTKALQEQYLQVSAYHGDNYLPLLWDKYRAHRSAILHLLRMLGLKSATQDSSLLEALHVVLDLQKTRRSQVAADIDLSFANTRWKSLVQEYQDKVLVSNRRLFEVCVLSYIADGLRCGDLFLPGSESFGDYREQLLPWKDCQKSLAQYCKELGLQADEAGFTKQLKEKLSQKIREVDEGYPQNQDLFIDKDGSAHLRRLKAIPITDDTREALQKIRKHMPERHLLDVLNNVHHWTKFTRHFGPLSGSDPKLPDRLRRYLFTVFGYGCGLGASQTARHTAGDITRRILARINKQHVTAEFLDSAICDVINEYKRFDLPTFWGNERVAIADGTHVELRENNLLGEQHIRYGAFGGIAYHHISDTYVALFSHFTACGVWEAVHILDAFLKNKAEIQPDTVHADTQGQSEPVFGLALLLGIKLLPRMRTWNDVIFYRPHKRATYNHIDDLFTSTVNWVLIKKHWIDMMQVVLSIKAGKVLPSMLLQKLGTYSRHNKLYLAFRELGRVARTLFLLDYISNQALRRSINSATTKIESFNAFCDWVSFGGESFTSDDPVEHEKRVKYTTLVANAVMLHNVLDLTTIIMDQKQQGFPVTIGLVTLLSPYMTKHLKRFGNFILDTDTTPPLLTRERILIATDT